MRKQMLAASVILLVPFSLRAQSHEDSWDNLRQLRSGQKIEVVNMKLKSVEGRFAGFSDASISLRRGQDEVTIPRDEVFSVKNRETSHRGRNALLGLAIGAAGGLAAGAIKGATYHEEGETPVFVAVFTPIGAGIGAAVGAALPTGPVTIYRTKPKDR